MSFICVKINNPSHINDLALSLALKQRFKATWKVVRETGWMLCRIALWDCFGGAVPFFIGYYKVARELGTNSSPKLSHSATGHNSDPVSSSTPEGPVRKRGNFPLAECNEISGKCFSLTRWGPGYRSCDRKAGSCFCCARWLSRPLLLTFPPNHLKISGNFVISLVFHLSRGMLCVHFYKFGIKVRLRRSAWHGYQWCVRIVFYHNSR